jgi:hypothetical protein
MTAAASECDEAISKNGAGDSSSRHNDVACDEAGLRQEDNAEVPVDCHFCWRRTKVWVPRGSNMWHALPGPIKQVPSQPHLRPLFILETLPGRMGSPAWPAAQG